MAMERRRLGRRESLPGLQALEPADGYRAARQRAPVGRRSHDHLETAIHLLERVIATIGEVPLDPLSQDTIRPFIDAAQRAGLKGKSILGWASPLSQLLEHDKRINISRTRMLECAGKSPHDRKPQLLP